MERKLTFYLRATLLLTALTLPSTRAATCHELFQQLGDRRAPLQCAEAAYFAIPDEFSLPVDLAEAGSGQYSARFDGFDLFGEGETRPANLHPPFSASTTVDAAGDLAGLTEIAITHDGRASYSSRPALLQTASFETKSRIVFVPTSAGAGADSIPVTFRFDAKFFLQDDQGGSASRATARAIASFDLIGEGHEGTEMEGLVELDLNADPRPTFAGEFSAGSTSTASGDGFEVATAYEITIDLIPGQEVAFDSGIYGLLLSDSFAAGAPDTWSITTPDPATVTISSAEPDVRFQLVPELPVAEDREMRIVEWKQTARDENIETYTVSWDSLAGELYRIESSPDARDWAPVPDKQAIPSQGDRTTTDLSFDTDAHPRLFIRVGESDP